MMTKGAMQQHPEHCAYVRAGLRQVGPHDDHDQHLDYEQRGDDPQ
jgi:hypothetical protein